MSFPYLPLLCTDTLLIYEGLAYRDLLRLAVNAGTLEQKKEAAQLQQGGYQYQFKCSIRWLNLFHILLHDSNSCIRGWGKVLPDRIVKNEILSTVSHAFFPIKNRGTSTLVITRYAHFEVKQKLCISPHPKDFYQRHWRGE